MTVAETEAILEAVRAVLEPDGLVRAATGRLRRVGELAGTLDHSLLGEPRVEPRVRSARIVAATATTAIVDLDAVIDTVATGADGRVARGRIKAQGPVQLVREDDGWKVVDLVVDGVSLLAGFFDHETSGSHDGLAVTILGGRIYPAWVLFYVELRNETGRPVTIRHIALGQRRTFLRRWRWTSGSLPVKAVEPGQTRVDFTAELHNAWPERGNRLLLETDAGLVDARPASVPRPARRIPVSVRYPWGWSSVVVMVLVAAMGALLSWWLAGLVLLQACGLTLLKFAGYGRAELRGPVLARFALTLAGCAVGVALFMANGGFAGFHGPGEKQRVTEYVERIGGADVLHAEKVAERRVDGCDYTVWDVQTRDASVYVVGDPITVYPRGSYRSPQEVISAQVGLKRRIVTDLESFGDAGGRFVPRC